MGSRGANKKNRNKALLVINEDESPMPSDSGKRDKSTKRDNRGNDDGQNYGLDEMDYEPSDDALETIPYEDEIEKPVEEVLNFDDLPFEVLDQSHFRGVYRYHQLDKLGKKWRIISREDPEQEFFKVDDIPEDVRFGLMIPTYAWVKDGKVMQLFVDGMDTQALLDGLELEIPHGLDANGNVLHGLDNNTTLAKRLSRILRPESIAGEFDRSSIRISHELPTHNASGLDPEAVKAVWDGAGVVTRGMLQRMIDQLPQDLPPKSRIKLMNELLKSNRFEFTIMTEKGQLKGHASVIEDEALIMQKFSEQVGPSSEAFQKDLGKAIESMVDLRNAENQRRNKEAKDNEEKPEEERVYGRSPDFETTIEDLTGFFFQKHQAEYMTLGRELVDQQIQLALRIAAGLEDNHYDFLVPKDYKDILRTTGDKYQVSFKAPKTSESMHLDIQSNINLANFWSVEQKQQWLRDESEIFEMAVRSGDMGPALTRIDPTLSPEKLGNWPLVEFGGAGGNPNWSSSIIKQIMNQHLKKLRQMEIQTPEIDEETGKTLPVQDKFSLPIPGGRYYVFPAPVARTAGKDIHVGRGEVHVDKEAGTVWVNEEDWLEMRDAAPPTETEDGELKPWGLARILGGMDNDDALWVHEYHEIVKDEQGQPISILTKNDRGEEISEFKTEKKVLIWRSPNGPGEYADMKASANSDSLPWHHINEKGEYVAEHKIMGDSSKLFPRIDHALNEGIIIIEQGNIEKTKPNDYANCEKRTGNIYLDSMYEAAKRAARNKLTLGQYCNLIMVEFASRKISKTNPLRLPAATEDVIDAAQKTGADTSKIKDFIKNRRLQLLTFAKAFIPQRLHHRLNFGNHKAKPTDGTDQLTRTDRVITKHVAYFNDLQKELQSNARPPHAVIEYGLQDENSIKIGREINSIYQQSMNEAQIQARKEGRKNLNDKDWEQVNQPVLDKLNEFKDNPEKQHQILAAAWTSAYFGGKSDAAIWAMGAKRADGTNGTGTFHMSIDMLQGLGLLNEPSWDPKKGLQYIPNARPVQYHNGERTDYEAVQINGAIPNLMDHMAKEYIEKASPEMIRHEGLQKAKDHLAKNGQFDLRKQLSEDTENALRAEANRRLTQRLQDSPDRPINIVLKSTIVPASGKERLEAYTEDGFRLGRMDESFQHRFNDGDRLSIRLGINTNGNIVGTAFHPDTIKPVEDE